VGGSNLFRGTQPRTNSFMTKDQAQARIKRAERHAEQDQLIAGTYGKLHYHDGGFNGCSVGCDAWEIMGGCPIDEFHNLDHHQIVADHDGTAYWFELVRDTIFEGLPKEQRSWWHIESAKALAEMPEDVDWDNLRTAVWLRVLRFALEQRWSEEVATAIEAAIAYLSSPVEDLRRAAALWANLARDAAWEASRSESSMIGWGMARSSSSLAFALVKLTNKEPDRPLLTVVGAAGAVRRPEGEIESCRMLADRILETTKTQTTNH
jgi:hypothetical protein